MAVVRMSTVWRSAAVLTLLTAAIAMTGLTSSAIAGRAPTLRSLHARVGAFYGDDFVIVEPVGPDVRIRVVRVAWVNEHCPRNVVQAVERVVKQTTVDEVAATRVCDITEERVERALKDAPPRVIEAGDFLGSLDAVVADCGDVKREFVFIMPPIIDRKRLRRQAPEVDALWELGPRLQKLVMGPDASQWDPFSGATPEVRAAREVLGTALVPDMLAGEYGEYLSDKLTGYTGPPVQREPLWVEVPVRESLNLAHYVEPVMPQIAISARVMGDVTMKVSADRDTGAVTSIDVVASQYPTLLNQPAIAAAKQWRFAPGGAPAEPVEVTVRFRLRCPE